MAKLFCITGVDGTGKSTLLKYFKKNQTDTDHFKFFNLPQYHLGQSQILYASEVELLEEIGKLSDLHRLPLVKASVTYIQYCMFGKMLKQLPQKSKFIILERFPLIDLLVFSKFYLSLIEKNLDFDVRNYLLENYSGDKLELISKIHQEFDLYNIHKKLVKIFKLDREQVIEKLKLELGEYDLAALYHLNASKDLLEQRLSLNTNIKEAHENISTLWMMQNALKDECLQYSKVIKEFRYQEVTVDSLRVESLYQLILDDLLKNF